MGLRPREWAKEWLWLFHPTLDPWIAPVRAASLSGRQLVDFARLEPLDLACGCSHGRPEL